MMPSTLAGMTISGLTAATEYLFVRATALERANATLAPDGSHARHIAECNGTTGGNAVTNMNICGEFRILTATSDISDPTATAVDSASTFIAFKEVSSTTLGNGTDPANASPVARRCGDHGGCVYVPDQHRHGYDHGGRGRACKPALRAG